MTGLDTGYVITSDPCDFVDITADGGPYACDLTAEPEASTFTMFKEWIGAGPDITTEADINWECTNGSEDTGDVFDTLSGTWHAWGADDFDVVFYPAPDSTSVCSAWEDTETLDSAVESDQGCADGTDFVVGTSDDSCTIVNSVFYEGIPTLSQYGMAIMALLMLGVGFVGFRRFV
jgi:hypothetical protein